MSEWRPVGDVPEWLTDELRERGVFDRADLLHGWLVLFACDAVDDDGLLRYAPATFERVDLDELRRRYG